mgnify:CR=1 FL=1
MVIQKDEIEDFDNFIKMPIILVKDKEIEDGPWDEDDEREFQKLVSDYQKGLESLKQTKNEKMTLKDGEVSAENVQKMADLAAKYFKAGIQGVPNIINKIDIVKK